MQQSIYNDAWSLKVYPAGKAPLFYLSRQVNAQLHGEPRWHSNGSTGLLTQTFDIAHLTAGGDTEIYLVGSATNVGDSKLPTSVMASISFTPGFSITSVANRAAFCGTGANAVNDYVSIPRPGNGNIHKKIFRLKPDKPKDSTVLNVKASLLQHSNNNELMTVVDELPGIKVTPINDTTFDVTVSVDGSYSSTIASQPSAFHNMHYKFRVEADLNSVPLIAEKEPGQLHAWWRMPDGFNRFGPRDSGGDNWAAKGTYEWLQANANYIMAINDISGEHSYNLGHTTHCKGTDLDIYHFTNLVGLPRSGGGNYNALYQNTVNALNGNQQSQATVANWITQARAGLDNLIALNTVTRLISGEGSAGNGLPQGWLQTLMETGQLTAGRRTLNLGIGNWAHAGHWKLRYNIWHNTHIHVDLNDGARNNNP